MSRDTIFAAPQEKAKDFAFDGNTAEVFDDMLHRSVPMYGQIQSMVVALAAAFVRDNGVVFDLGCSTGTTLIALASALKGRNARLIGIDSSQPMLDRAAEKAQGLPIEWLPLHIDEQINLAPCDVAILTLTLQFIRPLQRQTLLRRICESITPGGCLILVEKVLTDDPAFARLFIDLYHDYKAAHGYSQLEIAQKREALENVLVPYRAAENIEMLRRSGFTEVETFFRWFNFAGFVAKK